MSVSLDRFGGPYPRHGDPTGYWEDADDSEIVEVECPCCGEQVDESTLVDRAGWKVKICPACAAAPDEE